MKIRFFPSCIGKTVTIKGKQETVISLLASNEHFRILSEANGPVIHDYSLKDIQATDGILVSFDGEDFVGISIRPLPAPTPLSSTSFPMTPSVSSSVVPIPVTPPVPPITPVPETPVQGIP